MSEYEYAQRLEALRNSNGEEQTEDEKETNLREKKKLTFLQKISKHWAILMLAIFFDILALIPFISPLFNFTFAGILLLYFSSKKKPKRSSEFQKIFLPVCLGSVLDFLFSIFPVNITAAVIRIASSDD